MIKSAFVGVVAALGLGAPAVGHAQIVTQPMPPAPNYATDVNATITGQPQPAPNNDWGYNESPGYVLPGYVHPFTPRTVWIPGRYDWDLNTNNYVWTEGQYVEAPRDTSRWEPGHWLQTPTAWIWVDGRWN